MDEMQRAEKQASQQFRTKDVSIRGQRGLYYLSSVSL
jgi:hypothetical protein